MAVDNTDGDCGHRLTQSTRDDSAFRFEVGDGVSQCDIGAGDGGGAGTTVRLENITVDGDGVFTQGAQVDCGAQ